MSSEIICDYFYKTLFVQIQKFSINSMYSFVTLLASILEIVLRIGNSNERNTALFTFFVL